MTFYIKMPVMNQSNPNYSYEAFKTRYSEVIAMFKDSETIGPPKLNEQGTHYLVHSQRLTQAGADILKDEFPMVSITTEEPQNWTTDETERGV